MVFSSAGKKAGLAVCLSVFLLASFLGANALWTSVNAASSSPDTTSQVGVVIPLYTYPTDNSWAALIQAKENFPSVPVIAIINPDSGPGNSKDENFVTGIADLENAGITVLGYVATGYGTSSYSSLSNIEGQVQDYKSWYPDIQGILFDEMSSSANQQNYYQTVENYVSSLGMNFTAGNPGTTVDNGLIGIFNLLCIYENPGLPAVSNINQYYSSYGNDGFAYVAYGVSSLPSQATMQSLDTYVSYIYITNMGGSNPYNGLPSYFTAEMAALATVDSTTSTTSSSTMTTTDSVTSSSSTITATTTSTTASITTSTATSSTTTSSSSTTTTTSSSTQTTTTSSTSSTVDNPTTTSLTVNTVLADGQAINGYYVDLSQNGATVAGSYSPAAFTVQVGQNYVVTPENYGDYVFSYWNDTGSIVASRSLSISQPTTLVAVYRQVTTVHAWISIKTSTLSGERFSGMYTVVLSSSGKVLESGYSPLYFNAVVGNTYVILVDNYQNIIFNHWNTGSRNPYLVIHVTGATTYVAYYSIVSHSGNVQQT